MDLTNLATKSTNTRPRLGWARQVAFSFGAGWLGALRTGVIAVRGNTWRWAGSATEQRQWNGDAACLWGRTTKTTGAVVMMAVASSEVLE